MIEISELSVFVYIDFFEEEKKMLLIDIVD